MNDLFVDRHAERSRKSSVTFEIRHRALRANVLFGQRVEFGGRNARTDVTPHQSQRTADELIALTQQFDLLWSFQVYHFYI